LGDRERVELWSEATSNAPARVTETKAEEISDDNASHTTSASNAELRRTLVIGHCPFPPLI
jgi:hypothetical protein